MRDTTLNDIIVKVEEMCTIATGLRKDMVLLRADMRELRAEIRELRIEMRNFKGRIRPDAARMDATTVMNMMRLKYGYVLDRFGAQNMESGADTQQ